MPPGPTLDDGAAFAVTSANDQTFTWLGWPRKNGGAVATLSVIHCLWVGWGGGGEINNGPIVERLRKLTSELILISVCQGP